MNVELKTSPASVSEMESNAALAALTCHGNAYKEHVPTEVLSRIIKAGHESVLEHITLTYSIKGISRALLQEVSRHRHISLSVESTRHTLRTQLLEEEIEHYPVRNIIAMDPSTGRSFNFLTEYFNILENLARNDSELSNDELRYYVPEFWPTNLVLTVNIRELRHILNLRTSPAALKEFRELCHAMYEAVPDEYKYLLRDRVHEEA